MQRCLKESGDACGSALRGLQPRRSVSMLCRYNGRFWGSDWRWQPVSTVLFIHKALLPRHLTVIEVLPGRLVT
ncbi:hypothetical protein CgunFtcFv8_024264 [Champsocephalus gunnari]|uniref:Uncharacterized protein n=1 Tax=Champsocephalus gunnari TaxID=52237 RepID=A0AAN8DBH9_CHAGU|nr:hypothetical protein CgunFtcFv8_024264 [Champsocephalus gunnari]